MHPGGPEEGEDDMSVIVLVHGALHYGDLWRPTAGALAELNYEVHHPTAYGNNLGDDVNAGHDPAWRSVADYIVDNDLRDVALVGHSWGGTIVSKVAEAVTDRLARLVYYSALILADGQSELDELPPTLRRGIEQNAAERGDGTFALDWPVWRDVFIQDATTELARQTFGQLRPHPVKTVTDRLDLTRFYTDVLGTVPTSVIDCTADMTLGTDPNFGFHPHMSARLGLFRLVQLPGATHEVLLTDPVRLAGAIDQAVRP